MFGTKNVSAVCLTPKSQLYKYTVDDAHVKRNFFVVSYTHFHAFMAYH
jgi:hypothetical protein